MQADRCGLFAHLHHRQGGPLPTALALLIAHQRNEVRALFAARHPGPSCAGSADPVEATRRSLAQRRGVVHGAAFASRTLRAAVDAVMPTPAGVRLVHVTAGARPRRRHVLALALAAEAAAGSGTPVAGACVVHVDASVPARAGAPDLVIHDVSAACLDKRRRVPDLLDAYLSAVSEAPAVDIGPHCRAPEPCPYQSRCWAPYGERTIYHVARLSGAEREILRGAGFLRIDDVPEGSTLVGTAGRSALDLARRERVSIDVAGLRGALANLRVPLAYLDLEFATPTVPLVDGMRPFEPLAFQYSCHVDVAGSVRHDGHLHRRDGDPRPALARSLATTLAPIVAAGGSVVVFDAGAERRLLEDLARAVPDRGATLRAAAARTWDLLRVVRDHVHHYALRNELRLSRVVDVIARPGAAGGGRDAAEPGAVPVANGVEAQWLWRRLRSGDSDDPTRDAAALERYCAGDSAGMLQVTRVLRSWCA